LIPLFFGFDPREEVGAHAFIASVLQHATQPVSLCPLHLPALPMYEGGHRDGTNAFIYSRFLVPELMEWKGWAIFADGCDMVLKADVSELWTMRDRRKAVQVVKHEYKTRHQRKYVGTSMEAANLDYPRKNWSSLMLINCEHPGWMNINAESVEMMSGPELHRFSFLEPDEVGSLPAVWNWLADEYGENKSAKLLHWTAGIPAWPAYRDAPHASDWWAANQLANHANN
jgi:hypothetical protein